MSRAKSLIGPTKKTTVDLEMQVYKKIEAMVADVGSPWGNVSDAIRSCVKIGVRWYEMALAEGRFEPAPEDLPTPCKLPKGTRRS